MSQVAILPIGKRAKTKVQNRTAILDAAREVFGEIGYEPCTVRDIIRRTGLAAGTFYNYFKSKEEVFAALADDGARRFAPILKALRSQNADFEGFVRSALRRLPLRARKTLMAMRLRSRSGSIPKADR